MARRRLDAELVRRGLADSRERARTLIQSGSVTVAGVVAVVVAVAVTPVLEDSALIAEATCWALIPAVTLTVSSARPEMVNV